MNEFSSLLFLNEPPHDKTNKMTVRPAKIQISLGIRPVWSEYSLSAWRNLGSLASHWAHSEDWSVRADAQADPSHRWAHSHFVAFVVWQLMWSNERILCCRELLQNIETSGHKTMYHTPVIVMEGINHGHFASGTMPPNVKSHDLQAEMSYDSAHDVIAGHVSSFLMASLQQPASEIVEAEKALNTSHKETLAILKVADSI